MILNRKIPSFIPLIFLQFPPIQQKGMFRILVLWITGGNTKGLISSTNSHAYESLNYFFGSRFTQTLYVNFIGTLCMNMINFLHCLQFHCKQAHVPRLISIDLFFRNSMVFSVLLMAQCLVKTLITDFSGIMRKIKLELFRLLIVCFIQLRCCYPYCRN